MGIVYSYIFNSYEKKPLRTILIGLDNAGKTTLLYQTAHGEAPTTIPTIGFNVETIQPIKGLEMTVWDIGGQSSIRSLWKFYTQNCEAVIWIVDSNDPDRFGESKSELEAIVEELDQLGCPILVFANKQDLPNAVDTSVIIKELNLNQYDGKHPWYVQGCVAVNGTGLEEGYRKMVEMINRK